MKDRDVEILRSPELLAIRDAGRARLETVFDGTQEDVFFLRGPDAYTTRVDIDSVEWMEERLEWLADRAREILAEPDDLRFRPLSVTYNPREVHYIDHLLGAEVVDICPAPEECNWQVNYLKTPVGELRPIDLASHPVWQDTVRFTEALLACELPAVHVGMPTISSALNIAMNLYGQEFLIALMVETDAATRDLRVINDLLLEIHRWYVANVPADVLQPICAGDRYQPVGFGQLCACSAQLISAETYAEHILPLDAEILQCYPNGGMVHICGAHAHQIPNWRRMPEVRAIQFNYPATKDFHQYWTDLRDDQVLYLDLREEELPLRTMLAGSDGGKRCVFVGEIPDDYDPRTEKG
jgi:hypothetical protein